MNKHPDSPNFCSTLDGLLPKFKRLPNTDPLDRFTGGVLKGKQVKSELPSEAKRPRRSDRDENKKIAG